MSLSLVPVHPTAFQVSAVHADKSRARATGRLTALPARSCRNLVVIICVSGTLDIGYPWNSIASLPSMSLGVLGCARWIHKACCGRMHGAISCCTSSMMLVESLPILGFRSTRSFGIVEVLEARETWPAAVSALDKCPVNEQKAWSNAVPALVECPEAEEPWPKALPTPSSSDCSIWH